MNLDENKQEISDNAVTSPEENEKTASENKYEKVPLWSKIALILAAVCAVIYLISCFSQKFADMFNIHVSFIFRFLLAQISNILPFSLAEAILISLPILLFLTIRYLWLFCCNTRKATKVSIICIFSVASMFFSSFVLTFATGYRGTGLEEKLDIESEAVDAEDLYLSAEYIAEKINYLSKQISYSDDGFSQMPYSLNEMNTKLIAAYDTFSQEHGFIKNYSSRLKPVMLSEAMSYAHITGIYTFFTGESNININFPDYTIPYTAAHELAHQRGIAKEDEANMIAFLVSIKSDDPYIQYSAYVNMYEYVANALYRADRKLFKKVNSKLETNVYKEQVAYSKFFDKYEKSVTAQVSGAVNDVYLKGQGTEGKKSYGMVVDLTVAYLKSQALIPK